MSRVLSAACLLGGGAAALREAVHVEDGAVCAGSRSGDCDPEFYVDGHCRALRGVPHLTCTCPEGYGAQVLRSVEDARMPGMMFFAYTCCPGRVTTECGDSAARHWELRVVGIVFLAVGAVGVALTTWWLLRGGPPPWAAAVLAAHAKVGATVQQPAPQDGELLHKKVPMQRWCVTRDDLVHFQGLVLRAVREGSIQPTDRDPFDPADTSIGPNIHTVTRQYIKPVTAAAGGMSWALMRNPSGLDCDLFVTHSWAEGIFEFTDKVLNSWPSGAKHAYCCMLSNPQNLDISGLIATPLDSPFAQALRSASHMLAVPNHAHSIYSRVWCTYEAYLAYSWGKTIETAESTSLERWPRIIQAVCLYVFVAGVTCSVLPLLEFSQAFWITLVAAVLFMVMLILRHAVGSGHRSLAVACQVALIVVMAVMGAALPCFLPHTSGAWFILVLLFIGAAASAADVFRAREAAKQVFQLQHGFTGRLSDAKCSVPADGERIQTEVRASGSEQAVDHAVSVLIRMGMSTPDLRSVAQRTGELGNVSHWELTHVVLLLGLWIGLPTFVLNVRIWYPSDFATTQFWVANWHDVLATMEGLVFASSFVFLPRDRQAFAAKSLVFLTTIAFVALIEMVVDFFNQNWHWCDKSVAIGAVFIAPLYMLGVKAGPAYVARVPLVGPAVVRCVFGGFVCGERARGVRGQTRLQAVVPDRPAGPAQAEDRSDGVGSARERMDEVESGETHVSDVVS